MSGLEHLRPFAETERQHDYLDAIKEVGATHPSSEAAELLGVGHRNLQDGILRLKKKAALRGISNDSVLSEPINESFAVKGTSTLYDEAGNVKIQWVKTDLAKEHQQEAFKDFIGGLCSEIEPVKPVPQKDGLNHDSELMSAIFIGDSHINMRSFASETRHSDFDLDKAINGTKEAVDDLISRAPNSETGLLVNLGDLLHANSVSGTTAKGTPLDTDKPHVTAMRECGMLMRYCINQMLKQFKQVNVISVRGNHDTDSGMAIALMLEFYYSNEPRVKIIGADRLHHYVEFGANLFGFAHGEKQKANKLVSMMARDMAQAWGRTSHRAYFLGHVHHKRAEEFDGCLVESFGVLASPDLWHKNQGYGATRSMSMITFKRSGGRLSTHIYELPDPIHEPDITVV